MPTAINPIRTGGATPGRSGLREEIVQGPDPSADDRQALADSRYQLGALLARRGAGRPEEAAYAAALEVQERLVQQAGNRPEYRTRLARYRNNVAMLQEALGRSQDAEATFRATLKLLEPLVQGPAALPGARWQFARVANNLGALFLYQKRDEAGEQLRSARDILIKLAAEFPAVAQYQQELATAEYNLGFFSQRPGHLEDALPFYQEAARLQESLLSRFPGTSLIRLKLAMAHVAISECLARTAPAEAVTAVGKALDQESALLAEFPDVPEYQSALGRGHYQLAKLLLVSNPVTYKPAEALHQAEEARKLLRQSLQSRPDSDTDLRALAEDQGVLTLALIDLGRLAEAVTAAGQLPATRPADPAAYVHAAALLIRCARASPSTPEGQQQAEGSLARAVSILGDAVRAKLIRSSPPLDLPELGPLRNREDFKEALRDTLPKSEHAG